MSSTAAHRPLDFAAVNRVALSACPNLLHRWFPAGRLVGREFCVGNIRGDRGDSLRINIDTGCWADFGDDAGPDHKGRDLVALYALLNNLNQGQAARDLGNALGLSAGPEAKVVPYPKAVKKAVADWVPIMPVPASAPEPSRRHFRFGDPVHVAEVCDRSGALLHLICRFEPAGQRKQIFPLTFGTQIDAETGEVTTGWSWRGPPVPRPLYGLPALSEDRPVLLVEGEAKRDAAQRMLGDEVAVLSWPNGSDGVSKADLSPLQGCNVVVWPDADKPGEEAARAMVAALEGIAVTRAIVPIPEGKTDGWDLADAEREGWTEQDVLEHIARAVEVEDGGSAQTGAPSEKASPDDTGQEQTDAPKKRRSKFVSLSIADILSLPPPEYRVEGVLVCGGYAGLYGPPGSLKSFLMIGIGLAVAYGKEWAGRKVKQAGVLYVAGEGAAGFGKRIRAWQQHFGMAGVDAPFRLISGGVNLTSPEDTAEIVLAAIDAAEAEGQPIGLVVFDTVARSMVGADENSATDMGKFNENCAEIIRELPGAPTVVAVHHTGKDVDRGARGSNSFLGAVDTMLKVTRDKDKLTLRVEKQKEGEDGFDVPLMSVGIREPDAPEDTKPYSLVVVGADGPAEPPKAKLSPDQRQAFDILCDALAECGVVDSPGVPNGKSSVPEDWWRDRYYNRAKPGASVDTKQKAFRRAADALCNSRMVATNRGRVWLV